MWKTGGDDAPKRTRMSERQLLLLGKRVSRASRANEPCWASRGQSMKPGLASGFLPANVCAIDEPRQPCGIEMCPPASPIPVRMPAAVAWLLECLGDGP